MLLLLVVSRLTGLYRIGNRQISRRIPDVEWGRLFLRGSMVRILIADDHLMARLALSEVIERADRNWKVCCEAEDGRQALEKAAELKPDLVMLDFAMPHLDGVAAGQKIRAALPRTPVLVYSFMVSPRLAAFVKSAGLQGVVDKANTQSLISEIRRVLSRENATRPDAG